MDIFTKKIILTPRRGKTSQTSLSQWESNRYAFVVLVRVTFQLLIFVLHRDTKSTTYTETNNTWFFLIISKISKLYSYDKNHYTCLLIFVVRPYSWFSQNKESSCAYDITSGLYSTLTTSVWSPLQTKIVMPDI